MPEIVSDFTTFLHEDAEVNGVLVSYWPTVEKFSCDVCGEFIPNYVKLFKDDKTVRCCTACAKSVLKRWSK